MMVFTALVLTGAALALPLMAQAPRAPDVRAQRDAMKKLAFLIGRWSGDAKALRAPGAPMTEMLQTEEAAYKLDGLVLTIEGVGRIKSDGSLALQALGVISFDDEALYRMRASNDGRWLETEVKLAGEREITWGFSLGEFKTSSLLRINEKGEWTGVAELTVGSRPPRRSMELTVRRVQ